MCQIRDKMGKVLLEQMEGRLSLIAKEHHLSFWAYQQPGSPNQEHQEHLASEKRRQPSSVGAPRVLDLGCGSGSWCFHAKSENPNWVVHGIDDSNHWLCVNKGVELRLDAQFSIFKEILTIDRDFMSGPEPRKSLDDYFSHPELVDANPQFTIRSINRLLQHDNPIPTNTYSLVRGRHVFHKVESFMNFLDSVRLLAQNLPST
jgi:SAM-dependent methyltransferase